MKKALLVGINDYDPPNDLDGCVNDANELAALLEANGDGSPNFDVRRMISGKRAITSQNLNEAITELFEDDAETAPSLFCGAWNFE